MSQVYFVFVFFIFFTRAEVDVTRTRGSPRFVVRESESAAPSPKGHMEFAAFLNIGAELTIVDVRVDATSAAAAPPGMHVVRLRAADAVRSGASAGAGAGGFVVHDMSSRMHGRSLHRRPPPLACRQVLLERLPSSRARFASRFVSRHATAHSSGGGCGARVRGAAALDGDIARQLAELRDVIAAGWRCRRARGRSPGTFRGGDSPGGGTCRWFPRLACTPPSRLSAGVVAGARTRLASARAPLGLADGASMDAFEIIERVGRRSKPALAAGGWGRSRFFNLCNPRVDAHVQGYNGVNGAVFRARHIATGVVVALKLM